MGLNTTKIVGQSASEDNARIQWSGLAVQSGENDCFILSMYIQDDADGFDKLENIAKNFLKAYQGNKDKNELDNDEKILLKEKIKNFE